MKLNGNKLVKTMHVFVPGDGCYFPTKDIAVKKGTSPNGTGFWLKTITFKGKTWFMAGNRNAWD